VIACRGGGRADGAVDGGVSSAGQGDGMAWGRGPQEESMGEHQSRPRCLRNLTLAPLSACGAVDGLGFRSASKLTGAGAGGYRARAEGAEEGGEGGRSASGANPPHGSQRGGTVLTFPSCASCFMRADRAHGGTWFAAFHSCIDSCNVVAPAVNVQARCVRRHRRVSLSLGVSRGHGAAAGLREDRGFCSAVEAEGQGSAHGDRVAPAQDDT
jgi:hypothetical protein